MHENCICVQIWGVFFRNKACMKWKNIKNTQKKEQTEAWHLMFPRKAWNKSTEITVCQDNGLIILCRVCSLVANTNSIKFHLTGQQTWESSSTELLAEKYWNHIMIVAKPLTKNKSMQYLKCNKMIYFIN